MREKEKEKGKDEAPEKEAAETPDTQPLLDLLDAPIKKLIRTAKQRGYVTHDQVRSLAEEVNSEQIEDVLAMCSAMGVNVAETEEAADEDEKEREEADDEAESEGCDLVEVAQKVPAKSDAKEPVERTDDPVRMYFRAMGSIQLLSRQGEIAVAKRIEAGHEAMIAGLCESLLTFQASSSGATSSTKERSSCATSSTSKPPMPAPTPRRCRSRSGPTASRLRLHPARRSRARRRRRRRRGRHPVQAGVRRCWRGRGGQARGGRRSRVR
jgi:hypothetical protein